MEMRARMRLLQAVLIATSLGAGQASAFELKPGIEDTTLRWDNTFRHTLSGRTKSQDAAILATPNSDDGDRNFGRGIVSNRLDLLSEFDAVYKESYGLRLSGAGWYDLRYDRSLDNGSAATSNHLDASGQPAVGLNRYSKRYFAGPRGEVLDAFAFANLDVADVPVRIKVGRHTVYWGEAMLAFGGTHGVSYAQSPIDLGKALAQPGVELKEIFRPLNQVSAQVQPLQTLSIAAQYMLQWEPVRFPQSGTYLGFADPYLQSGSSIIVGPGLRMTRAGDITPRQARDWGVSARWTPEWLSGTVGLYYRNFSDRFPQLLVDATNAGPTALPQYRFAYADDVSLYGVSFAKQILGVSVGAEGSIRHNMPLLSNPATVGIPGAPVPGKGDTAGARGNTLHALVNFLYIMKTPLFDKADCLAEVTYSRWLHVASGDEVFKGNPAYTGLDHVTRNAVSGALNFTPTWYHVFSNVDVSMPLSVASGLSGVSAVTTGGAAGNGSYSAGISLDYLVRYTATLSYSGFFGTYATDATGGISSSKDVFALLKDRDMVTMTLKATF